MMDDFAHWHELLRAALALVAMTAVGVGFLVGLTWMLHWTFGDLVAAAIVAGAAPIIASFSFGIWSDYRERHEEIEMDRRQRRGQAYESFLRFLFDAIEQLDDDSRPDQLELDTDRYARFVQDLLIWGSDDLIELWNEYRTVDFEALEIDEQRRWYGRLLEQVHRELRGGDAALDWEELYRLYSTGWAGRARKRGGAEGGEGLSAER